MSKNEILTYIWGTGRYGERIMHYCKRFGMDIAGLIDSNEMLWNTEKLGLTIYSPKEILQKPDIQIFIALVKKEAVKEISEICNKAKVKIIDFQELKFQFISAAAPNLDFFTPNKFKEPLSCTSQLCNQYFWNLPLYQYWCEKLKQKPRMHRKQWEWVYVAQVLFENGFLKPGSKGLCFAAGQEPLPALFASLDCKITATDLDINTETAKKWAADGQNAENDIKNLNKDGICPDGLFEKNVQFCCADMNNISDDFNGFDFNWSCCAFEHLGGIKQGLDFLVNNLKTLENGGIAVHTSEFNLTSDEDTFESEGLSIFRKRDYMRIADKLEQMGHYVYPMDFRTGNEFLDNFVDIWPYSQDFHLRLNIHDFVSTSFGIIVRKNSKKF